jgi:hypothetical protein
VSANACSATRVEYQDYEDDERRHLLRAEAAGNTMMTGGRGPGSIGAATSARRRV